MRYEDGLNPALHLLAEPRGNALPQVLLRCIRIALPDDFRLLLLGFFPIPWNGSSNSDHLKVFSKLVPIFVQVLYFIRAETHRIIWSEEGGGVMVARDKQHGTAKEPQEFYRFLYLLFIFVANRWTVLQIMIADAGKVPQNKKIIEFRSACALFVPVFQLVQIFLVQMNITQNRDFQAGLRLHPFNLSACVSVAFFFFFLKLKWKNSNTVFDATCSS